MTYHPDRRYSLRELADHASVRQELDLADDAVVYIINRLSSTHSPSLTTDGHPPKTAEARGVVSPFPVPRAEANSLAFRMLAWHGGVV